MRNSFRIKSLMLCLTLCFQYSYSQSFNQDKVAFGNFMKRMYTAAPFEGVKVVDDYNKEYFISVVALEKSKYPSSSAMNRVAQVKAQSQANRFFNGSTITSDLLIKTSERKSNNTLETTMEMIESIKENSTGFTKGLELLTNFANNEEDKVVFVFACELQKQDKK